MTNFVDIEDQKIVLEVNGKPKEYDLLFTYDADGIDMPFIGYTDYTKNEKGELNIYVGKNDPLLNPDQIQPLTDPEELKLAKQVIEDIREKYSQ